MKLNNPFTKYLKKEEYKEKDQMIVSRWLRECEDQKFTSEEMLNLSIRFLVMVLSTLYSPTSWNRKLILKQIDDRLREAFAVRSKMIQKGENNE